MPGVLMWAALVMAALGACLTAWAVAAVLTLRWYPKGVYQALFVAWIVGWGTGETVFYHLEALYGR